MSMKILFLVNNVSFFVSHRLPLAAAAKEKGMQVSIMSGASKNQKNDAKALCTLEQQGLKVKMISVSLSQLKIFEELILFFRVFIEILKARPDILHCITLKSIIYGGITARILSIDNLVMSFAGMGFAFTKSEDKRYQRLFIRKLVELSLKFIKGKKKFKIIVQNKDDFDIMVNVLGISENHVVLIAGSGINLGDYVGCDVRTKKKIVLFPARVLKDKGILEFISAAKKIKNVASWRFIVAGDINHENPSSLQYEQISFAVKDEIIEWLGHVDDMVPVYNMAAIVCLPSYREGMPKALLEAAAAGCAVVTTDVPGCRDAIQQNVTGLLAKPQNADNLAEMLLVLINNENMRRKFGMNGQRLAQEEFSIERVVRAHFDLYLPQ